MRKHRKKNTEISGLTVIVQNDKFEKAHRQFKKKVQNSGKLQEVRDRRYYEKPTSMRRRKKNAAKRRFQKQLETSKQFSQIY